MSGLDWFLLGLYFMVMGLFIFYKKLFATNMKEFAITTTGVGIFSAFVTLTGSYIGPGYTMGLATKGFTNGIVYLFIFLGFSLQTFFVGMLLAPRLNKYKNALSLGDVIGEHYGRTSQIFTGILSFLYCVGIVGVVTKAAGSIGASITGLNEWICIFFAAGVVLLYTLRGGMKVVIGTDVIQFSIIVIGIFIALFGVIYNVSTSTTINLPNNYLKVTGNLPLLTVFGLFIGFLFGETLVPPYAVRSLITKESSHTKKAFIYSAIFSVFWFTIVISIGIMGKLILPESVPHNVFMNLMFKTLPSGLLGIVIIAIISTIMSTQDSYLNSAAVSFTRDIWLPLNKKKSISDHKQLKITRFITLIVALFGIFFAILIPGLVEGILVVYTFWAPTVIIPLISALLFKTKHPTAATYAILGGAITAAIWQWMLKTPFELPPLVPGILINALIFYVIVKSSKNRTI